MKKYTYLFVLVSACMAYGVNAQDTGTGPGWDNLNPASPLVINEDFQDYPFFHSDEHPAQGNSNTVIDEETLELIPGYMDTIVEVQYLSSEVTATFDFDTCAFAPDWGVANSVDSDTGEPIEPDPTTPGVTDGFVEISRNGFGELPGKMVLDLRELEYVEGIQYSHSSTGGTRRGLMVLYSLDDSVTWDTLRFQPGDAYQLSFTKDPFTGEKTPNNINCTPSANGMLWEDGIYAENVMLMFRAADDADTATFITQQAVRIHDLKVYGDLPSGVSVNDVFNNRIKIKSENGYIKVSETADLKIYSITGQLVKSANKVNVLSITDLPEGMYVVEAKGRDNSASVSKIYYGHTSLK